jgi:hypothetical protein
MCAYRKSRDHTASQLLSAQHGFPLADSKYCSQHGRQKLLLQPQHDTVEGLESKQIMQFILLTWALSPSPKTNLPPCGPKHLHVTTMSLPGSALNPQLLITALVTVVSLLVGLLLGNTVGAKRTIPKLIANTTQHLAQILAQVQEGNLKINVEDHIAILNALLQNLDEEAHPDVDLLHYIAGEVVAKRHPGQIYEVWLTRAYRRLAENPSNRLPEAWFVEPVAPVSEETDSDISDIAEVAEDDEAGFHTEAGPLVSPNVSSNNLSFETDELNTAQLRCFDIPAEVGLPEDLDMSAVD